jgi:hypothetical protein
MRQGVLDAEHILDGSWAQAGEVLSNAPVGQRLDGWRETRAKHLADGSLSELEQAGLTQFLQELSNLRAYLVHCYDRKDFPRTVPRAGAPHWRPQDPVAPHQRAQELE